MSSFEKVNVHTPATNIGNTRVICPISRSATRKMREKGHFSPAYIEDELYNAPDSFHAQNSIQVTPPDMQREAAGILGIHISDLPYISDYQRTFLEEIGITLPSYRDVLNRYAVPAVVSAKSALGTRNADPATFTEELEAIQQTHFPSLGRASLNEKASTQNSLVLTHIPQKNFIENHCETQFTLNSDMRDNVTSPSNAAGDLLLSGNNEVSIVQPITPPKPKGVWGNKVSWATKVTSTSPPTVSALAPTPSSGSSSPVISATSLVSTSISFTASATSDISRNIDTMSQHVTMLSELFPTLPRDILADIYQQAYCNFDAACDALFAMVDTTALSSFAPVESKTSLKKEETNEITISEISSTKSTNLSDVPTTSVLVRRGINNMDPSLLWSIIPFLGIYSPTTFALTEAFPPLQPLLSAHLSTLKSINLSRVLSLVSATTTPIFTTPLPVLSLDAIRKPLSLFATKSSTCLRLTGCEELFLTHGVEGLERVLPPTASLPNLVTLECDGLTLFEGTTGGDSALDFFSQLALLPQLQNITTLSLANCGATDVIVFAVVDAFPSLQSLNLSGNPLLTDGSIDAIITKLSSLANLNISRSYITAGSIQKIAQKASLTTFIADGCTRLGSISVDVPSSSLRKLSFGHNSNLSTVQLNLGRLTYLGMHRVTSLSTLRLHTPVLEELHITGNSNPAFETVYPFYRSQNALCLSALRVLNMEKCRFVSTGTVLELVSDTERLEELVLDGVLRLTTNLLHGLRQMKWINHVNRVSLMKVGGIDKSAIEGFQDFLQVQRNMLELEKKNENERFELEQQRERQLRLLEREFAQSKIAHPNTGEEAKSSQDENVPDFGAMVNMMMEFEHRSDAAWESLLTSLEPTTYMMGHEMSYDFDNENRDGWE